MFESCLRNYIKEVKGMFLTPLFFVVAVCMVIGVQLGVWLFANPWSDKLINSQTLATS